MKKTNKKENLYAARYVYKNGKREIIYMDREIMKAKPWEEVIHLNGNTLDNRRSNLKLVPFRKVSQD